MMERVNNEWNCTMTKRHQNEFEVLIHSNDDLIKETIYLVNVSRACYSPSLDPIQVLYQDNLFSLERQLDESSDLHHGRNLARSTQCSKGCLDCSNLTTCLFCNPYTSLVDAQC